VEDNNNINNSMQLTVWEKMFMGKEKNKLINFEISSEKNYDG
jgi:hypothetical protein